MAYYTIHLFLFKCKYHLIKIFWLLLQAVKFHFSMRSPYLSIVYSSSLYSLTSSI